MCNGVLTGVIPLNNNLPCGSERTFYHPTPLPRNRLRIMISLSQPTWKQLMEMMLIVTSLIPVLLGDVALYKPNITLMRGTDRFSALLLRSLRTGVGGWLQDHSRPLQRGILFRNILYLGLDTNKTT